MNNLIEQRLSRYNIRTQDEETNAVKEITQEIILYALSTTRFFEHVHFCGGTALRIIYGLERFSEDLDFTLNTPDENFDFDNYMSDVLNVLKQYGLDMQIKKSKDNTFVKKRELKKDSEKWQLSFPSLSKVVIKLEIDANPPEGAIYTDKILDFPILHKISIGTIETLFAGKMHALLCRDFVKGRDWYDFLWYVKNNHSINYDLLQYALFQMGPYKGQNIPNFNKEFVKMELSKKIENLDWNKARSDVERFIKPEEVESLNLWSVDLFLSRVEQL
ncbi:MAG: nucleotidyl transferase AbiEii/AbiGii toxin family protein [Candidatus Thioglobus sp.]|nr:nucleotidyl transferase AbiEii/AbiGii toxin family protein [Candidatus Thioglobus pontius]MBL6976577.1 nucleotidyl transferase AbiEii/AbiGii toxin family protein [Candidatus Thioglobus sp.]MBL6984817.1 nucleotidyl transferase AbiEii/AbiGii toxin family protein [Candidatus Thioglobus sp.]